MLLMLKLAASKPKLIIEFCAGRGLLGKTVAAKMGSDCYSCRALWIAWPGQIRDARATVEELRQSHDDASGKTAKMDLQKEIEKVSARTTRARVVCDRPRAWKNARGTR